MWENLIDAKMESVSPSAALDMVGSGDWVLVDVRPKEVFETASPEGAVNVPMFQKFDMANASPISVLRAAAYTFNGVSPVEPNPDFDEQLREAAGGKGVILMCEAGGTMKPSANFVNGKTSRSLKAAWIVHVENLAPRVAHLDGGVYAWYTSEAPMRGEYDPSNLGRTPNAAEEAKFPDMKTAAKK